MPYSIGENDITSKNLGLVLSFASIKPNSIILNFEILDLKSLDEIKKISNYKIINED